MTSLRQGSGIHRSRYFQIRLLLAWIAISALSAQAFVPNFSSDARGFRSTTPAYQSGTTSTRQPQAARAERLRLDAVAKSGGRVLKTEEEFAQAIAKGTAQRPVLVFFTAPWCGPCRLTAPVVKDIVKQFTGKIDVVEVCTDDLPGVAEDCGVVSIPTIQLYSESELMDVIVGCVAKSVLANSVTKVLENIMASEGSPQKDQ